MNDVLKRDFELQNQDKPQMISFGSAGNVDETILAVLSVDVPYDKQLPSGA